MLRKSLIILFIIFCFLCISNVCFANDIANSMKDGINSAASTMIDGAANLATDVRNGVGDVENGIEGALDMNTSSVSSNARTATDDYTAARTASATDMAGTTAATDTALSTMWIWVIVAIAAIVIVGMVWYYGSQNRVD